MNRFAVRDSHNDKDTLRKYFCAVFIWLAAGLLPLGASAATPDATSDASLPAPPRSLVFLNWSEYIDPELVEKFEQQFSAQVSQVYFESDDLRDDMMLETGAVG